MSKAVAILLLIFLNDPAIFSQDVVPAARMGASLKLLLSGKLKDSIFITQKNGRQFIPVIIETDGASSAYVLKKNGYQLRTIMGNVATADIAIDNINKLAANPSVKRIELPLLLRKTDTLMRRITTVKDVIEGKSPLTQTYTGKNVVIGVIDDGIDISHPDFYGEDGHIRIRYLWNMEYSGNHPPGEYSYGQEWTADSMEYYSRRFQMKMVNGYSMQNYFGFANHGTSVTSLAAGNSGVAAGAEIVAVAFTATANNLLRADYLIDGINYIYHKAQQENKKCVINISLGVMDGGPHDGKTLLEKAIDNFCILHPDLLVCVSAGNNGNSWKHWGGFPIDKDSSYGIFRTAGFSSMYFSIPKQYSKTLRISLSESSLSSISTPAQARDSVIFQSPYLLIDSLLNLDHPVSFSSFLSTGQLSSDIIFAASSYNDDYDELIVTPNLRAGLSSTTLYEHIFSFIFKGQGTLHAWYPFFNLHPVIYSWNYDPTGPDSTFHISDNEYSTIIPTNAFTVLSSGAYNIRTCYVNMEKQIVSAYERCRTTYFTSHGPTTDGRIKPDVLTPGENVFAARSRFDDFLGFDFILDTNHVSFGGTSAASPITAGITALIWERFPDYTRNDIVQLLKSTANFDQASAVWGPQPNNIAGWGKVDAFMAMTGQRTDLGNICEHADVCPGAIDPNDTIPPPPAPGFVRIYPNPVSSYATVFYISQQPVKYFLYDVSGRLTRTSSLPVSETGSYIYLNLSNLAKGMYFMKFTGFDKPVTQKIMVLPH